MTALVCVLATCIQRSIQIVLSYDPNSTEEDQWIKCGILHVGSNSLCVHWLAYNDMRANEHTDYISVSELLVIWWPSAILDLFSHIWTAHKEYLVVFIIESNLFETDPVVLIISSYISLVTDCFSMGGNAIACVHLSISTLTFELSDL